MLYGFIQHYGNTAIFFRNLSKKQKSARMCVFLRFVVVCVGKGIRFLNESGKYTVTQNSLLKTYILQANEHKITFVWRVLKNAH